MGAPHYVGHQWRTPEQQADMDTVFSGYNTRSSGKLDYVCTWFAKAVEYSNELPSNQVV